jgi:serine/threonine-protein kinase HipA
MQTMSEKEQRCYVYIQLPATFEWVPCASLQVKEVDSGAFLGTFTYGRRYLGRKNISGAILPECFFRDKPASPL